MRSMLRRRCGCTVLVHVGEAHDDSDWDVLVLSPKEKLTFKEEEQFMDHICDVIVKTGASNSIVCLWYEGLAFASFYYSILSECSIGSNIVMNEFDENMTAYVRYRLEKAQEVYQAACVLYDAAQWNSVINRLYYACFYSASALLLYRHISAKSHSGVIGQFSEQIVRPGIVSIDEFRVYAKLLNWRSKGDYNDLFDFSREDVDSMMEPTKHFIDKVASLIELE